MGVEEIRRWGDDFPVGKPQTQHSVPTQHSALYTQHSVPTQHSALYTQHLEKHSALYTQHSVPTRNFALKN
uniref:Uncharacterized protein n=1 Tax=Desertifilum tharense IPPAS B-1220 TaxID=1781255 RepID=A0ACD5GSU7_9CYAN